jgi:hypothetical protein
MLVHLVNSYTYILSLGLVRLQKRQIESELKVQQKERVPSCFDTRLWLYGLHGPVPSDSNEDLSLDSIYGKVLLVLACFFGGERNIKMLVAGF